MRYKTLGSYRDQRCNTARAFDCKRKGIHSFSFHCVQAGFCKFEKLSRHCTVASYFFYNIFAWLDEIKQVPCIASATAKQLQIFAPSANWCLQNYYFHLCTLFLTRPGDRSYIIWSASRLPSAVIVRLPHGIYVLAACASFPINR